MKKIKLSVVVPCFNSEKTLDQCLYAIRRSVYKNYELIVVDDGSTDISNEICIKHKAKMVMFAKNRGKVQARKEGRKVSKGKIVVNIDSDIVIRPDTLSNIAKYFSLHPKIGGITGILNKQNPNKNFSSQYKSLYMNYIFGKLPEKVTFFYGSIYAYRKKVFKKINENNRTKIAEDTEIGQEFVKNHQDIVLFKKLNVIHLKYFSLLSLIKNDFLVPYGWASVFLKYKGWTQLGRRGTGFAHASKGQIICLFLVPVILSLSVVDYRFICLIFLWFVLNFDFCKYLYKEKGLVFTLKSMIFTFFDHLIMMMGVICGTINHFFR
jgi:glycosyltransferase involved in cell wall biosynthesis